MSAIKTAPKKTRRQVRVPTLRQRLSNVTLGDLGSALGEVWDVAHDLIPMLNVEVKSLDTISTYSGNAAGFVIPQTALAQGADYNQRDGISIKAVSIESRLTLDGNAAANFDDVRIVYFIDTQNQGTTPAVTDLLEATDVRSAFNHINLHRFVILVDDMFTLSLGGPTAKASTHRLPLDHHVKYTGAASAAANLREGNVFFMLISQQAVNTCYLRLYTRFSFVDN